MKETVEVSVVNKEVVRRDMVDYAPRRRNIRDESTDVIHSLFNENTYEFAKPLVLMIFEAYAACDTISLDFICKELKKRRGVDEQMDFLSDCIDKRTIV